jgi:pantetheine-phosphate adenylyltransferase
MAGVDVVTHGGLAVQAATDTGADVIVKGLRTGVDFDIEQQMAQNNHALTGIRTVFVPCAPALSHISSRFVREIAAHGTDVSHLVPSGVHAALRRVIDGVGG